MVGRRFNEAIEEKAKAAKEAEETKKTLEEIKSKHEDTKKELQELIASRQDQFEKYMTEALEKGINSIFLPLFTYRNDGTFKKLVQKEQRRGV